MCDLSRRIFREIIVESEGFAFSMEVAYKWLPDASTTAVLSKEVQSELVANVD